MLGYLKAHLYKVYSFFFTWQSLVEGTLIGESSPVRILVMMDRDGVTERSLLQRLFDKNWKKIWSKRSCYFFVRGLSKKLPESAEFGFIELPIKWSKLAINIFQFKSPSFVRQKIALSGDIEDIKRRFIESSRRQAFNQIIREKKFSYWVTDSWEHIHKFYTEMYVPHIKNQFGPGAWVLSFEAFKRNYANASVLFVNDGTQDVAGSLFSVKGNTMYRHQNGVKPSSDSLGRNGVQTAIYVFTLIHAKSLNLEHMDLGHARSFLNDGVFKYKRSWGAEVYISESTEKYLYFSNPYQSNSAKRFLTNNPMLVEVEGNFVANCVIPASPNKSETEERIKKLYKSQGIIGALIIILDESQTTFLPFI